MNYRNIKDLNNIILQKLSIIPRDFDLIVGVPRSGMLPANLLSLYLNRPYTDIDSFLNGHIYKAGARSQFFDSGELPTTDKNEDPFWDPPNPVLIHMSHV